MTVVICKDCGDPQTRVWKGSVRSNGRKVYVNDDNKAWRGFQCPDCLSPSLDRDPLTHRICRACSKPLPKSRYFNHSWCVLQVVDIGVWEEYSNYGR